MVFSPINQGLTSPTPLSFGTMPFSFNVALSQLVVVLVLIDVCIYMMPNYNVPYSTTYHRQLSALLKHTQQNRWWGFFLELLTTINYIIYIMQTGSKLGHYIISHKCRFLPQVVHMHSTNKELVASSSITSGAKYQQVGELFQTS